jgi:cellobiose-specific phosphotransferase system component IIA
MSSVWAVDKYLDLIREKREREYYSAGGAPKYEYFDTLYEAREFILRRAEKEVLKAENALRLARNRHRKCVKKFSCDQQG